MTPAQLKLHQKIIVCRNLLAEMDRQGKRDPLRRHYLPMANGTPFPAYRSLTEKTLRLLQENLARTPAAVLEQEEREERVRQVNPEFVAELDRVFADALEEVENDTADTTATPELLLKVSGMMGRSL